jgi:nitrogen regulatory protein P-II 1
MKLVVAIIRPEKYGTVQAALDELGVDQLTLTEVVGRGHERGAAMFYRGMSFREARIGRLKLEIVVEDNAVDDVVEAVRCSAMTGQVGDGVILVSGLEDFVRIRTGRRAKAANGTGRTFSNRVAQAVGNG